MSNLAPNPGGGFRWDPQPDPRGGPHRSFWAGLFIGGLVTLGLLQAAYKLGAAKEQERAIEAGAGHWVRDAVTEEYSFRYRQFFRLPTKDEAGGVD